jgi:hypothetical protein
MSVNSPQNLARRLEEKGLLPQCGNVAMVAEGLPQTIYHKHMNYSVNSDRFCVLACVGGTRISVSDKSTRPLKQITGIARIPYILEVHEIKGI